MDVILDFIREVWGEILVRNMEDSVTLLLGLGGGLFTTIVFFFMYMRNRETAFEQQFTADQIAVISDSDKKKQQQKKGGKKSTTVSPSSLPNPQKLQQQQPAKVSPAPQKPKDQPKNKSPPKQPEQAKSEVKVAEVVEQEQKVQNVQPVQSEAPPPPPKEVPKKTPKPINSCDLDQKKVLDHLSKLPELDTAYVSWLKQSFQSHDTQMNNKQKENVNLDKKNKDLVQRNEKLSKDKRDADEKARDEQNQRLQTADKFQKLQARETELVRQIQQVQQTLNHREQNFVQETQKKDNNVQKLENDLRSAKYNLDKANASSRSSQQALRDAENKAAETERNLQQKIDKYEAEKQKIEASLNGLRQVTTIMEERLAKTGDEYADQANKILALTAANNTLQNALNAAKLAVENQSKHSTEELDALREEQKVWLSEKEQMTEKYVRLEELIKELNVDMNEFHVYKEQQERIVGELNQRDNARLEELEQSQAKETDLLAQLKETKEKLAEVKKSLKDEQSRVVEIPKNSPEPVVEEEAFELKKTNADLAQAAPGTSSSDSALIEELKAKNAVLDEKNNELRQRNMTILEKTEAVPNQLESLRKQVVAELGSLAGIKMKDKTFKDEQAFSDWVGEARNAIEKKLNSASSTPATAPASTPAAKPQKPSKSAAKESRSVEIPEGNEHECRKALIALIKELEHIEKLVDKQEHEHKQELARLRSQLV
ncbi:hypothetical protein L3Y34_010121 [Caenorhabditis briggsae]|uniref:Uncharacterized protein n=1 Tax=Caenorhabditis briggsae TaxID=6238 RepID=A0AAE9D3U9_CAEBR|nr:hypothetical protein L3Y34_010121 [Caenorhabditis briggsae]